MMICEADTVLHHLPDQLINKADNHLFLLNWTEVKLVLHDIIINNNILFFRFRVKTTEFLRPNMGKKGSLQLEAYWCEAAFNHVREKKTTHTQQSSCIDIINICYKRLYETKHKTDISLCSCVDTDTNLGTRHIFLFG